MRIGIDLGGTKIEGLLLDDGAPASQRERLRVRMPTPTTGYQAVLEAIAQLVQRLDAAGGGGAPVGIGIPGTLSPATGLVKNANSTALIGHPLDRDLTSLLARPVRVANDANCFALSEAVDGAAAPEVLPLPDGGPRVVFGVILGTGVGAGLVVEGRVLGGPHGITGEWGHNPLPWPVADGAFDERPGPACYCGRQGCLETFLSGPGLARDHLGRTGRAADPVWLVREAAQGDTQAEETLRRYEDRLARGLAMVINILDPTAIVLGGGLSNLERLYENVPRLWNQYVFSDVVTTPLLRNRHGDSSGVRGAAWLWPAQST